MKKVPEIRFAEYVDDWEQRKVGGLTIESSEYATLDTGLPLLTSSRNGLMYQNEYCGKQTTDSKETLFSIVPLGACTYRHMSDDDVFHLNVNRLEKGLVSREYPVFYASENNNLNFIVQQINSSAEFRSFCAEQKKGGTRTRLYYKNLCEFQMLVPNVEEQEEIATFLITLDRTITLHQRKLEKLMQFKSSMLEKMFPQNGESVPEIRFAGFTDAWEQRKFSDFTFPAGERNKDDLDLKPFAITNNQGFIAQIEAHDDFVYTKDVDRKMYIVVKPNSFAYNPARINVGSWGYYEGTENVIVSSLYEVFQTAEYVDDKFLKHWFKTKVFQDWIERLQEGSVRLYFYYDKLCECIMSMPSVEEQRKIGAYLDKLDSLITLHQRKLEKLKQFKSGLLDKMFI